MLKAIFIVLIQLGAGIAIYRNCYLPYRFNIAKRSIERSSLNAFDAPDRQLAAIAARRNLHVISRYANLCDTDVDVYMYSAVNYRILERYDEAVATYRQALKIDRRPEVYFNLGMTQIDAGDRDAGIQNLVRAIVFHPDAGYMPDPQISSEVHQRVHQARQRATRSLLLSGD